MYLIFGGERYYAYGGGFDLLGIEEDAAKAKERAESLISMYAVTEKAEWSDDRRDDIGHYIEWAHVVDGATGKIIAEFGDRAFGAGAVAVEIRKQ